MLIPPSTTVSLTGELCRTFYGKAFVTRAFGEVPYNFVCVREDAERLTGGEQSF